MKFSAARAKMPSPVNLLMAILSAILLILAFPDFEIWISSWFSLVPLFYAIWSEKESLIKSFVLGWIWGIVFFFGSCWWLTFSLVTYGSIPAPIAYFLLLLACSIVSLFPAVFAALYSILMKRFGMAGIFIAPFLWIAIEFLRFWTTGNNWNAVGYSQAFKIGIIQFASIGGIYLVGFLVVLFNSIILVWILNPKKYFLPVTAGILFLAAANVFTPSSSKNLEDENSSKTSAYFVAAVQPNVPMSGLKIEDLQRLRRRHVELAESALQKIAEQQQITKDKKPVLVIFPESPMNFEYTRDREFQGFLREFTAKYEVSVLFNAAEPSAASDNLYNSAVLVDERGAKQAQYDKIYLVPFGEYVPLPEALAQFVPTMVGNFEIGKSYNLIPYGDLQAGIMICFESHFPNLTREFARQGADALIELTNDGYLGNTPVLRQHLANAVFRAVEINRPVLRVTNVGITAYIDERGKITDATEPYTEDTRVWTIRKSDAPATFYVKYGDWFAWVCSIASAILLIFSFRKRKNG